MALPAGAATATITVGVSTDIAGEAGTITGLAVRPECRLVWAATGQPIEDWNVGAIDAATATLVVLADQDGVVTSGTVAGAPALVAIRSWPMQAVWWVKSADGQRRKIVRRFPAALLTAGGTLDLDLLPAQGVVPPAQITYAQGLDFSTDMVADLAVGTVATGAPGTPAVASLTPVGDDAYTLDLTIPQGGVGDPAPLPAFTATATTGAPGTNAAASVSGTYPDLSLDLTIPEGEQGNPGPATRLTIGTVTTGAAGSSAAATITGDAPSQTLNLTIPTGATGAVSAWEYYAAGRPDVVGTLDAAALAWRNAAPSGSTFYSTDGPQGAWVWRKRGATWVCVEGATGVIDWIVWTAAETPTLPAGMLRIAGKDGYLRRWRTASTIGLIFQRITTDAPSQVISGDTTWLPAPRTYYTQPFHYGANSFAAFTIAPTYVRLPGSLTFDTGFPVLVTYPADGNPWPLTV